MVTGGRLKSDRTRFDPAIMHQIIFTAMFRIEQNDDILDSQVRDSRNKSFKLTGA